MSERKTRILFLNPPSIKPVIRDGYCSDAVKGAFSIHPLDLLVQSGYFAAPGFDLEFIDAVRERTGASAVLDRIAALSPDVVLSLAGEAVWSEDAAFFRALKSRLPSVRLFLSGDIPRFRPEQAFVDIPSAEGLLMDFSRPALRDYLESGVAGEMRLPGGDAPLPTARGAFCYPRPQEAAVRRYRYELPFFSDTRFYSLLTSYGCPYQCRYCNTNRIGHAIRDIDEIADEMRYAASLGFHSLYLRDATFMADRERTMRLFEAWEKTGCRFEWIAFTRPELLDEELAARCAALGCRTLLFGVESYDAAGLAALSRDTDLDRVQRAFHLARKSGIESAAMILTGLGDDGLAHQSPPGAVYEKKLRAFLDELDPDFISLNVYHTRPGVVGSDPVLDRLDASRDACRAVAARVNRRFYLRPIRILRRLRAIRSFRQFALLLKIAADLIVKRL